MNAWLPITGWPAHDGHGLSCVRFGHDQSSLFSLGTDGQVGLNVLLTTWLWTDVIPPCAATIQVESLECGLSGSSLSSLSENKFTGMTGLLDEDTVCVCSVSWACMWVPAGAGVEPT